MSEQNPFLVGSEELPVRPIRRTVGDGHKRCEYGTHWVSVRTRRCSLCEHDCGFDQVALPWEECPQECWDEFDADDRAERRGRFGN